MREVYVNIGSVEKAKGLNGVLRKLEGDFDLVQGRATICLLYTSPSPRDGLLSRMPSSA